jgi:hypothetical protein
MSSSDIQAVDCGFSVKKQCFRKKKTRVLRAPPMSSDIQAADCGFSNGGRAAMMAPFLGTSEEAVFSSMKKIRVVRRAPPPMSFDQAADGISYGRAAVAPWGRSPTSSLANRASSPGGPRLDPTYLR